MIALPARAATAHIERDTVVCMDALEALRRMDDASVNCIVTSPPYYGLRDYGIAGQIGLEDTPAAYVERLRVLFAEARRVLRDDGTLWLNIGDSYGTGGSGQNFSSEHGSTAQSTTALGGYGHIKKSPVRGMEKQLLGIPWRLAFALQDDGWILRSEIIWHKCLSGGAYIYARTQKGDMPMMVRDAARLSDVQLWNGQKWTRVIQWERLPRKGNELEIVLRSGERISCTPEHRFPTQRGLTPADQLQSGDVIESARLPEPETPYAPPIMTNDAAWFIGMYLAEGSRSGDTIQIAGHAKETGRLQRLRDIAAYYGGTLTYDINGNNLTIRMYGRFLNTIIDQYVSGKTAKNKGLKVRCWSHSNEWLRSLLHGYLEGDGHWDAPNARWRLGFTRNYNLERDLRILAARLGLKLTIKTSFATMDGRRFPTFRGELRLETSNHFNEHPMTEIVEIRSARCREVYDVTVEDEPHLFALASGVLTHNSNPMPESVRDRPTKAHEQVFLFSKQPRYWYDADAIAEPVKPHSIKRQARAVSDTHKNLNGAPGQKPQSMFRPRKNAKQDAVGKRQYAGFNKRYENAITPMANARTVWTIPTKGNSLAHFAMMPPELARRCILAGCPRGGVVHDPFMGAGTTAIEARKLGRHYTGSELNPANVTLTNNRLRLGDETTKALERGEPITLPMFASEEAV